MFNYKVDVDTSANVMCEQDLRFVYYVNLACTGVIASKSSNLYFREHYRHYVIKKFEMHHIRNNRAKH